MNVGCWLLCWLSELLSVWFFHLDGVVLRMVFVVLRNRSLRIFSSDAVMMVVWLFSLFFKGLFCLERVCLLVKDVVRYCSLLNSLCWLFNWVILSWVDSMSLWVSYSSRCLTCFCRNIASFPCFLIFFFLLRSY